MQQIFTFLFCQRSRQQGLKTPTIATTVIFNISFYMQLKLQPNYFGVFLSEEETTEADNNNGGNNLPGKLQYYSWPVIKVVSKPLCFLEEDTSGANIMWKLISSSFAVLLFLFF